LDEYDEKITGPFRVIRNARKKEENNNSKNV